MAAGDGRPGLPAFQLEVARVFFALPASKGFLLAGGAALDGVFAGNGTQVIRMPVRSPRGELVCGAVRGHAAP